MEHNKTEQEDSSASTNILKLAFLIAVLVGAWFLLDWLINGKR